MADTKISNLAGVAAAAGANELAVNEAGVSKKATVDQLTAYVNANITLGADLTVNSQEIISAAGTDIVLHSDNDVHIILGDDGGVNEFTVKDFTATEVFSVSSSGAVAATSYGGITEANLVDKSATEAITGAWDFGGGTLELPNGAGGTTVDAAGEICVDTTSKTVNFFDGAAEKVLQPELSKAVVIESPTDSEDISLFFTDYAITITKMICVMVGSTPSVTWTLRHGTDRSAAGAEVVTGGTTTTSTTTGSVVTSFNDATIVADSFVWLETTAQSGTVTSMNLIILYTQDP